MSTPPVSRGDALIGDLLERHVLDAPAVLGIAARLEQYDVIRVLGQGGLGVVLLAFDNRSQQFVAVKMPRPEHLDCPKLQQLFRQEIDLMSKVNELKHPNIVQLLASGEVRDVPYFVMPYLESGSLARRIVDQGPLDWRQALQIARSAAAALAAVHTTQGIWHRDIKPENILIDVRGHVVLADFGLAFDSENVGRIGRESPGRVGTTAYMAPEVAVGGKGDARADIYGVGTLLLEALLGDRSGTVQSDRSCRDSSRLADQLPDEALDLIPIIDLACAARLEDRYAEMQHFAEDLTRVERGLKPLGRHRRSEIRDPDDRQNDERPRLYRAAVFAGIVATVGWSVKPYDFQAGPVLAAAQESRAGNDRLLQPRLVGDRRAETWVRFVKARAFFHSAGRAPFFGSVGFAGKELEQLEAPSRLPRAGERFHLDIELNKSAYCTALVVDCDGGVTRYTNDAAAGPRVEFRIPPVGRDWHIDSPGLILVVVIASSSRPPEDGLRRFAPPSDWSGWKLDDFWKYDGRQWTSGPEVRSEGPAAALPKSVQWIGPCLPDDPRLLVRGLVIPCREAVGKSR